MRNRAVPDRAVDSAHGSSFGGMPRDRRRTAAAGVRNQGDRATHVPGEPIGKLRGILGGEHPIRSRVRDDCAIRFADLFDPAAASLLQVFSDLHVSRQTLPTCLEVLEIVSREAKARDAGIVFLGDFWHVRGSLPVEPLNAVLEVFSDWSQPTLMIPGNHDQVNLEGNVHALLPIASCSPNVVVFDEPTLCMGALWLPYRRNARDIEQAIGSVEDDVKAIFAHVDVVGADYNETFQSSDGIDATLFPARIPTYSGHYHKPQTVWNTNIHYIGSQHQLSFSEERQAKRLIVLDADWKQRDAIPIDVGPRHFTLDAGALSQSVPDFVRPGDRVRYRNCKLEDMADVPKQLQDMGVSVELQPESKREGIRIEDAEQMKPVELLRAYAQESGMDAAAERAAVALISEVEGGELANDSVGLSMRRVSLEGYGPFAGEVEYTMHEPGMPRIRVISGW